MEFGKKLYFGLFAIGFIWIIVKWYIQRETFDLQMVHDVNFNLISCNESEAFMSAGKITDYKFRFSEITDGEVETSVLTSEKSKLSSICKNLGIAKVSYVRTASFFKGVKYRLLKINDVNVNT